LAQEHYESIQIAEHRDQPGIDLTGEGLSAVYRIRGYFVAGAAGPIVGGTVVSVMNDLPRQPIGTSGPFVLFPAAE
jgi:hypothetical protein